MSDPVQRITTALREHGHEPRKAGAGWCCRCPAHDDRNPSLSIHAGDDGRALVNCHAGCTFDAVCRSIGLRPADLFIHDPSPRNRHAPKNRRRGDGDETTPKPARGGDSVTVASDSNPYAGGRTFASDRDAMAELERRHGPKAGWWTYTDPAGTPVCVVVRFPLPPDPEKPNDKPGKVFRPVTRDGSAWFIGSKPTARPLYRLPDLLATPAGSRVYVCEGERTADAARAMGLVATTSPHGSESAAKADWSPVAGREVVILPDHDDAGERYANDVVRLVTAAGAKSVRIVRLVDLWAGMPKGGDIVDYLNHRGGDTEAVRGEVEALTDKNDPMKAEVKPDDDTGDGDKPAQAEQLVRLALEVCRLGQTPKREPFAVFHAGPNVAGLLRGSGGSLRDILAREYRKRHGRVMNATAFADALTTLRGDAIDAPSELAHLRVGPFGEAIVLDLGTVDGSAVVVDRNGWRIVDRSPILFQRTALSGEMPTPTRGGRLDELRGLLNVTDGTWPILIGWMVAALIPEMPHPILMLGGMQGTGKTTAARFVCGLFDPSDAPIRSQPRDPEAWAMGVANGWTAVIDNVSTIPEWWSDALCKAVTGDGWVRRTLYSDGDVSVLSFRRVVVLTSIDAGALRGDLGDRLVLVDLDPITPDKRRTERALDKAYRDARPAILGALLDLLANVLARLDSVEVLALPRMADFARVLAAVDDVLGTNSLALYADQGKRIAGEVLDADPVGEAIAAFARMHGEWNGPAGALLDAIKPDDAGREWPRNGRGLAASLKRLAPALAANGVGITPPIPTDRKRVYRLQVIAQTAQSPEASHGSPVTGKDHRAIATRAAEQRPPNRPKEHAALESPIADPGRSGDSGDLAHIPADNTGYDWEL